MNRCNTATHLSFSLRLPLLAGALAISLGVFTFNTPALAQTTPDSSVLSAPETTVITQTPGVRQFPANAVRGTLEVVQGAEILIDGQPTRLTPGAQVRGANNMLMMSGALTGRSFVVNLIRDASGNVHKAWILTDAEAEKKMKKATPERNFIFESEADKPKRDDGKTPFDQLPKFKN